MKKPPSIWWFFVCAGDGNFSLHEQYPDWRFFSFFKKTQKSAQSGVSTQRKQNLLLTSPLQSKTPYMNMVFSLRGRWVLTPRPLP